MPAITPVDLRPFLQPAKVALVGASTQQGSISARPAEFLRRLGYPGTVVAVHPSAEQVGGHPAFPSYVGASEGGTPDVALVLLPAAAVPAALDEIAEAGTPAAIVVASGFEGAEGAELRAEVHDVLAQRRELRVVGPNCNGVLSVGGRAPLCFSSVLLDQDPILGTAGLVTQSGAIGNGLLLSLQRRGVGLRSWFSTGDELSLGALTIATSLVLDEDTSGVGIFLEGMTDADALPGLAAAIRTTGKPVVALRAPQSAASRAAAYAHTGRLLGDDFVGRQALLQHGVDLVDSIEELADAMSLFSLLPRAAAGISAEAGLLRVGVLTVSGGVGVFAAEAVSRAPGLELARYDDHLLARLGQTLPSHLPVSNPLDVPLLGATAVFAETLSHLRESGCCDVVLVVASSIAHDYDQLVDLRTPGCPVVLTHLSPDEHLTPEQARHLVLGGGAAVQDASSAVGSIALVARRVRSPEATPPLDAGSGAAPSDQGVGARDQRGLLASLDLLGPVASASLPAAQVVESLADVQAAGAAQQGDFALKAEGSVVAHRTELGAVATHLSLERPDELARAFASVEEACSRLGERVVVQAMSRPGVEVLLSAIRDAEVGPCVLLRAGGTLVDLVHESVALAGPRAGWRATVAASPSLGPLLAGFRGAAPADTDALLELGDDLRASLAADDAIALIECNPVLIHKEGDGVTVVDVVTVMIDE
ncbi:MAG: acetate--CoA ligase family protein [Nocardioides sp.]